MRVRRFGARVAAAPRGRGVVAVPFDPDEAWGAKAEHPVGGTINGRHVRGTITRDGRGWAFTVTPMWMRDTAVEAGDDVLVELAPEVTSLLEAGIKQRPRSAVQAPASREDRPE